MGLFKKIFGWLFVDAPLKDIPKGAKIIRVNWNYEDALKKINYESLAKELNEIVNSNKSVGQTPEKTYNAKNCKAIAESIVANEIYNMKALDIAPSQLVEYLPQMMQETLKRKYCPQTLLIADTSKKEKPLEEAIVSPKDTAIKSTGYYNEALLREDISRYIKNAAIKNAQRYDEDAFKKSTLEYKLVYNQ